MNALVASVNQLSGLPVHNSDFKSCFNRFKVIMSEAKKLPSLKNKAMHEIHLDNFRDTKLADAMRLAGFLEQDCGMARGTYRKVFCRWNDWKDAASTNTAPSTRASLSPLLIPPVESANVDDVVTVVRVVSPTFLEVSSTSASPTRTSNNLAS